MSESSAESACPPPLANVPKRDESVPHNHAAAASIPAKSREDGGPFAKISVPCFAKLFTSRTFSSRNCAWIVALACRRLNLYMRALYATEDCGPFAKISVQCFANLFTSRTFSSRNCAWPIALACRRLNAYMRALHATDYTLEAFMHRIGLSPREFHDAGVIRLEDLWCKDEEEFQELKELFLKLRIPSFQSETLLRLLQPATTEEEDDAPLCGAHGSADHARRLRCEFESMNLKLFSTTQKVAFASSEMYEWIKPPTQRDEFFRFFGRQIPSTRHDVHESRVSWENRFKACATAARNRDFPLLRQLREENYPWDKQTMIEVIRSGDVEVFLWALKEGCPLSTWECAVEASKSEDPTIAEILRGIGSSKRTRVSRRCE